MSPIPVILDVDTGVEDARAIPFALTHPEMGHIRFSLRPDARAGPPTSR